MNHKQLKTIAAFVLSVTLENQSAIALLPGVDGFDMDEVIPYRYVSEDRAC